MKLREIRVGEAYAVRLSRARGWQAEGPMLRFGSDEWAILDSIRELSERINAQSHGVMDPSIARMVVEEVGVPWKGRPHGIRGIAQRAIPRVKDRPDQWTVVYERDENGRILHDVRDVEIVVRFSAVVGQWDQWARQHREERDRQRAHWEAEAPERERRRRAWEEAQRNSPDPAVRERQRHRDERNAQEEARRLARLNMELFDLLDQDGQ